MFEVYYSWNPNVTFSVSNSVEMNNGYFSVTQHIHKSKIIMKTAKDVLLITFKTNSAYHDTRLLVLLKTMSPRVMV